MRTAVRRFSNGALTRYGLAVLATALAAGLGWLLDALFAHTAPFMTLLPAVFVSAVVGGIGPGLLATGLAAAMGLLWFREPHFVDRAGALSSTIVFVGYGGLVVAFTHAWYEARKGAHQTRLRQLEIEARARHDEAVHAGHERFRTMIEAVPSLTSEADPQGNLTFVSERWCDYAGLPAEAMAGTGWLRVVHPDDLPAVRARWAAAVARGTIFESKHRLRAADGAYRWFMTRALPARDDHGVIVRWAASMTDIDALVQTEAELRRTHQQLVIALESMSDGFVAFDQAWTTTYVNPAAARLIGRPAAELLGRTAHELFPEHVESAAFAEMRRARAENRPLQLEHLDESTGRWHEIRYQPTPDGLAVYFQDITDRKRAEAGLHQEIAGLRTTQTDLERATRAKDEFLAMLSHELRTPLTPVLLTLALLQQRSRRDPEVRARLQLIRRNVELEARLIDDLLDVTRIARGKIQLTRAPVTLARVIDRAVEVVMPEAEARRLRLTVDHGDCARCQVLGDAARLQQVFWNLLKNAIKFTAEGGRVSVGTRCDGGAEVVTEVTDTGIGIEPQELGRIFDAFEQAGRTPAERRGGLGLGLTICKGLVEAHDGSIEADSRGRDRGATFRVRLPVHAVDAPRARPARHTDEAPRRPLRILLVEDHADTAEVMGQVLEADGHAVWTAGDAAAALALLEQAPFDLLISDLGLPDRSGLELMRDLRARGHTLSAIALTGYGQEEDVERSLRAGFAAHVTKPTSYDRLSEAIAAVTAPPA